MSAGQQRLTELSRQQPLRLLVQGPQVDEHPLPAALLVVSNALPESRVIMTNRA